MSRLIRMEFFKCRRRMLWLAPLILLCAQMAWGLWSYLDLDAKGLAQGWANILYDFPLLNAMMTPVIAAVVASRVADIEHKGQTLKLLETLRPTGHLFDAKFLCAAAWMGLYVLAQTGIMVIFGIARGFVGPPPAVQIGEYFLATLLVTQTILLFQLIVSLLMPNQMIGMILGLIGAFLGLFSLFFPQSLQKFLLWAYYGVLYVAAMDWDPVTRIVDYYLIDFDWGGMLVLALMFAALYLAGRRLFVRKEV